MYGLDTDHLSLNLRGHPKIRELLAVTPADEIAATIPVIPQNQVPRQIFLIAARLTPAPIRKPPATRSGNADILEFAISRLPRSTAKP